MSISTRLFTVFLCTSIATLPLAREVPNVDPYVKDKSVSMDTISRTEQKLGYFGDVDDVRNEVRHCMALDLGNGVILGGLGCETTSGGSGGSSTGPTVYTELQKIVSGMECAQNSSWEAFAKKASGTTVKAGKVNCSGLANSFCTARNKTVAGANLEAYYTCVKDGVVVSCTQVAEQYCKVLNPETTDEEEEDDPGEIGSGDPDKRAVVGDLTEEDADKKVSESAANTCIVNGTEVPCSSVAEANAIREALSNESVIDDTKSECSTDITCTDTDGGTVGCILARDVIQCSKESKDATSLGYSCKVGAEEVDCSILGDGVCTQEVCTRLCPDYGGTITENRCSCDPEPVCTGVDQTGENFCPLGGEALKNGTKACSCFDAVCSGHVQKLAINGVETVTHKGDIGFCAYGGKNNSDWTCTCDSAPDCSDKTVCPYGGSPEGDGDKTCTCSSAPDCAATCQYGGTPKVNGTQECDCVVGDDCSDSTICPYGGKNKSNGTCACDAAPDCSVASVCPYGGVPKADGTQQCSCNALPDCSKSCQYGGTPKGNGTEECTCVVGDNCADAGICPYGGKNKSDGSCECDSAPNCAEASVCAYGGTPKGDGTQGCSCSNAPNCASTCIYGGHPKADGTQDCDCVLPDDCTDPSICSYGGENQSDGKCACNIAPNCNQASVCLYGGYPKENGTLECSCSAAPNCASVCPYGGAPKGNGTQECACETGDDCTDPKICAYGGTNQSDGSCSCDAEPNCNTASKCPYGGTPKADGTASCACSEAPNCALSCQYGGKPKVNGTQECSCVVGDNCADASICAFGGVNRSDGSCACNAAPDCNVLATCPYGGAPKADGTTACACYGEPDCTKACPFGGTPKVDGTQDCACKTAQNCADASICLYGGTNNEDGSCACSDAPNCNEPSACAYGGVPKADGTQGCSCDEAPLCTGAIASQTGINACTYGGEPKADGSTFCSCNTMPNCNDASICTYGGTARADGTPECDCASEPHYSEYSCSETTSEDIDYFSEWSCKKGESSETYTQECTVPMVGKKQITGIYSCYEGRNPNAVKTCVAPASVQMKSGWNVSCEKSQYRVSRATCKTTASANPTISTTAGTTTQKTFTSSYLASDSISGCDQLYLKYVADPDNTSLVYMGTNYGGTTWIATKDRTFDIVKTVGGNTLRFTGSITYGENSKATLSVEMKVFGGTGTSAVLSGSVSGSMEYTYYQVKTNLTESSDCEAVRASMPEGYAEESTSCDGETNETRVINGVAVSTCWSKTTKIARYVVNETNGCLPFENDVATGGSSHCVWVSNGTCSAYKTLNGQSLCESQKNTYGCETLPTYGNGVTVSAGTVQVKSYDLSACTELESACTIQGETCTDSGSSTSCTRTYTCGDAQVTACTGLINAGCTSSQAAACDTAFDATCATHVGEVKCIESDAVNMPMIILARQYVSAGAAVETSYKETALGGVIQDTSACAHPADGATCTVTVSSTCTDTTPYWRTINGRRTYAKCWAYAASASCAKKTNVNHCKGLEDSVLCSQTQSTCNKTESGACVDSTLRYKCQTKSANVSASEASLIAEGSAVAGTSRQSTCDEYVGNSKCVKKSESCNTTSAVSGNCVDKSISYLCEE